jgi:putative hydrolase of the HAD superfamily
MDRFALEELVYGGESGLRAQRGEVSFEEHLETLRQTLGYSLDEIKAFLAEFWAGDQVDWVLIDQLRKMRAVCRTGLLSNAFSDLRQMVAQTWQFSDAFDEMIISAEEGLVKPDERIYQIALQRLGAIARESVFIDDFQHNVAAARQLGMQAIHFQSREQALTELKQLIQWN